MIPPLNSPIWGELVTGRRPMTSTKLAVNLLSTSVSLEYKRDPTPAKIAQLAQRVREFFVKYEVAFAADFQKMLS
jgi:hypothetical protein